MLLVDSNNKVLTNSNSPDINEFLKNISIIDYNTSLPLGRGKLQGWKASIISNPFHKELPPQAALFSGSGNASPDGINSIVDGIARVVFYISCDDTAEEETITLGFSVNIPSSDGFESDSTTVENSSAGKFNIPSYLNTKQSIHYNLQHLKITGQHIKRTWEVDGAISNPEGLDKDFNNYWRQFDYQIEFTDSTINRYQTHFYRAVLDAETPYANDTDYSFGERRVGFFAFKGYLWPSNIYDAVDGKPMGDPSNLYTMSSRGISVNEARVTDQTDRLFLTLFCSTGGGISFQYVKKPLVFTIYDQYGNTGKFMLDPDKLPTGGYDPQAFAELNFLNTFTAYHQPETIGDDSGKCALKSLSSTRFFGPYLECVTAEDDGENYLSYLYSSSSNVYVVLAASEDKGFNQPYFIYSKAKEIPPTDYYPHVDADQCLDPRGKVRFFATQSTDFSKAGKDQYVYLKPIWDKQGGVAIMSSDGKYLTKEATIQISYTRFKEYYDLQSVYYTVETR